MAGKLLHSECQPEEMVASGRATGLMHGSDSHHLCFLQGRPRRAGMCKVKMQSRTLK